MKTLDKNKDLTVCREEWMNSLCSTHVGVYVFNYQLKQMFEKFDTNNSGTLEKEELFKLMHNNFIQYKEKMRNLPIYDQFDLIVDQHTTTIIKMLDENQDQRVNFVEFKQFIEKAYRQQ